MCRLSLERSSLTAVWHNSLCMYIRGRFNLVFVFFYYLCVLFGDGVGGRRL